MVPLGAAGPAQARTPDPPVSDLTQRLQAVPATPEELPAPAADERTVGAVVETEDGLEVVTVEAEPDELAEVEADLERDPEVVDVVDVFVDVPMRKAASNDTYRDELWNLDALNVDLLPGGTPSGSGETVAVLDTGVRASHPDLLGRVDCTRGADFTIDTETSTGTGCTDPDGHGTHVAGTVSAITGNRVGVAGVSAAKIMPVRVLDAEGNGTAAGIIAGILWAVDHDASVINMSLGGEQTAAFDTAIQYASDNDVVVVVAAGNNRAEGNLPQSPASNAGVFSVAATDELGLSAPFSYSGPTNLISAPGDFVLSTTPTGYEYYSGTSMAAPHVAGIVARYRAVDPAAGVEAIRTAIQDTAIDLQQPGFDDDTGYGLIDMRELLTGTDAPADPARGVVPTAPRFTSVTPSAGGLTVEFDEPVWDGGSPITQYRFTRYRVINGKYFDDGYGRLLRGETDISYWSGLINGATYVFYIRADNANGMGQYSMGSPPGRPRTVPLPPAMQTPRPANGAVVVRWSAPDNGGSPITSYRVDAYEGTPSGDFVTSVTVPVTSTDPYGALHEARVSGLTNGRGYAFYVIAWNAAGAGPGSVRSAVAVPRTVPGAPSIGRPAAANDAARVYWRAPADNGGAYVSGYVVRAWQGARLIRTVTVSGTAKSALVTGLKNRNYYAFTVTAKNAAGLGTPSARSSTIRTT